MSLGLPIYIIPYLIISKVNAGFQLFVCLFVFDSMFLLNIAFSSLCFNQIYGYINNKVISTSLHHITNLCSFKKFPYRINTALFSVV